MQERGADTRRYHLGGTGIRSRAHTGGDTLLRGRRP